MIKFSDELHSYTSIVPDEINWLSVTTLIGMLHEKFQPEITAPKCSRNKKSKWYGMPVEEILAAWKSEGDRSTILGSWYHNKQEQLLYTEDAKKLYNVVKPIVREGIKYAPWQELENFLINDQGIFPEHLVYLESAGICGQADQVHVQNKVLNIGDYKTCKEIKKESFEGYDGHKMMLGPVKHLQDSNYWHYALQLSFYAYMILKHNPWLKLGDMIIHHILFEVDHLDKYGYPVYLLDENGEPIVTDIVQYKMPYLRKEVIAIIDWLKTQKQ
jgi:hypothetical protein